MSVIDACFLFVMIVFIVLLLCAIIGKIIAKKKENEVFTKTCCPIYTVQIENDSAA